ncbi:MAG TPA: hypothetical protein VFH61_17855 [Thermoleophilia bacterium]|nr:hypothetical protein [Thermoleophilia bacterium]
MTWYVEDGKVIEGGLAPFFTPEQLAPGMKVQIVPTPGSSNRRRLKQATITRSHFAYYTGSGSIDRKDCWSTDDGPVTKHCELTGFHDSRSWRVCVHVKYRNGVQAVIHLSSVRPQNSAVLQLAEIVEDA